MSKPDSRREATWKQWLGELRYICHSRFFKAYVKNQANRARRQAARDAIRKGER